MADSGHPYHVCSCHPTFHAGRGIANYSEAGTPLVRPRLETVGCKVHVYASRVTKERIPRRRPSHTLDLAMSVAVILL